MRVMIVGGSWPRLVEALEDGGHEIMAQAQAEEALSILLDEVPCEVALVNLVMPRISGIEFVRQLTKQGAPTASIMMSFLSFEQVVAQSLEAGALDFLQRPFQKRELTQSLDRVAHWQDSDRQGRSY